jgi:hypothetical protein
MCEITTDFDPVNCLALGIGGVSGDLYLINFNDWLVADKPPALDGSITDIILQGVGAKATKYRLTRGGAVPTSEFTRNAGGKSGWTHSVQYFFPVKGQNYKNEIAGLANYGRVVAIVVLDNQVVANIYGNDVGLVLNAYSELPNDPSKGGGLDVTIGTPDDTTLENLPPLTFFDTDRVTTLAKLEALTTPVPSV